MATQRVKLNPECKRSLLVQTMKLRSPSHRQTIDGKNAFKFFKLLASSKSFVNCSRRFEIYSLRLELPENLHTPMKITMFSAKNLKHCEFKLTLEQTKKLFSIIRPIYFGIQQGEKFFDRFIKEIRDLLHVADGKIGLFFNKEHIEFCHLILVEEFSSRLRELKCTAEMLEYGKFAQKMRLESCEISNFKSIGQLAKIMRHEIKKLTVNVDRVHYLDEDEVALIPKSDDELRNTSVENVHLNCKELSFDEATTLVEVLLESCPSLKNFSVEIQKSKESRKPLTKGRICRYALSQHQKIIELEELFSISPFKPHIKLKLMLPDSNVYEYNKRWYEDVEDQFVGWKFNSGYEFESLGDELYHVIPGMHNYSTYFTFEDEECKLELDLTMSIFGEMYHEMEGTDDWVPFYLSDPDNDSDSD